MIFIKGKTPYKIAREILIRLYSSSEPATDPELIAEDSATIVVEPNDKLKNWVAIKNRGFVCTDRYDIFSPFVDPEIIEVEKIFWKDELFREKKIEKLIKYLKKYPLSKRAIVLLWKDAFRNLSNKSSCYTSIFFRCKGDKLEMHSSARASNGSFLLFLDLSFMLAVQKYVASSLGMRIGNYIHFVNSLHLYKDEKKFIKSTYDYLINK